MYIDQLKDRAPNAVERLIAVRQVNHSTIVMQELMFSIGALDPAHRRTGAMIGAVRALVKAVRPHRLFAPDADVLGRAAVLAGLLCRLQGYADSKMRALMDATLFLQAQKLGLMMITRSIGDFDLLLQLFPNGRVQMYRIDPA